MAANADPLQGSLFGDSIDAKTAKEVVQNTNDDLSDHQLAEDSQQRPRKRETSISSKKQSDTSLPKTLSEQTEEDLPAWSDHTTVDRDQLTPMLKHYLDLKKANPERILLYRLGDFFECFFEDAIKLSRILELTLTGKEGGKAIGRVPMAGIPHHAADR